MIIQVVLGYVMLVDRLPSLHTVYTKKLLEISECGYSMRLFTRTLSTFG